jgi:hypothetical protein
VVSCFARSWRFLYCPSHTVYPFQYLFSYPVHVSDIVSISVSVSVSCRFLSRRIESISYRPRHPKRVRLSAGQEGNRIASQQVPGDKRRSAAARLSSLAGGFVATSGHAPTTRRPRPGHTPATPKQVFHTPLHLSCRATLASRQADASSPRSRQRLLLLGRDPDGAAQPGRATPPAYRAAPTADQSSKPKTWFPACQMKGRAACKNVPVQNQDKASEINPE